VAEKKDVNSRMHFALMRLAFQVRDALHSRRDVLKEAGIRAGSRVLDYGCGTGSYIRETARLVGETGQVHALDVNPLAMEAAKQIAARHGLRNVRAILSDRATGLADESVDVVLLYDILHDLSNRDDVLREIHRVLKPSGILSVSDHHLRAPEIVARLTSAHRFGLSSEGRMTLSFKPRK
jgi:ubiquinone/menaquinone biosynthesis C-methylase UbiE